MGEAHEWEKLSGKMTRGDVVKLLTQKTLALAAMKIIKPRPDR